MNDEKVAERPLRILHLEDSRKDAEIIRARLIDAGLSMQMDWAANKQEFTAFLQRGEYDLVLADYQLPDFDAPAALLLTKSLCPDIPFIAVTGAVGDEKAIELLKQGATDYVLKDRLVKLPQAIERALIEVSEHKALDRLNLQLRESEAKYRSLFEAIPNPFFYKDCDGRYLGCNIAFERYLGKCKEEIVGRTVYDIAPKEIADTYLAADKALFDHPGTQVYEAKVRWADGSLRDVILHKATFIQADGSIGGIAGLILDITERKRTEDMLRQANRALNTLSAANLALVLAPSEDELLRMVTSVIVEKGGYAMAVVGYAEDDPEKSISFMAWAGAKESHYSEAGRPTWIDTEQGQFPIARAIRSGTLQICRDIASDTGFKLWRDSALARGYRSNIVLPLVGGGKTFGGLSIYSSAADAFDEEEVQLLGELASDLAYGIITLRARIEHQQHATLLRQALEQSIQAIASTVEARDLYTAGHERRVGELATAIAREMGLPEEQINGILFASIIHDLGKISVPSEILSKPGKLTDIEFMLVKAHPQAGYNILKNVKFPWPIADIVLQHHERMDGSGYPQGLKGGQILLEARVIAVADVMEAMSSHRPYRPGLGIDAALEEIERHRGVQYDPQAVDACIKLFREAGYKLPA